jgi:hypothetical protein
MASGCGATGPSAAGSVVEDTESQLPSPPALSADEIVAEVQANAASECMAPAGVDEMFCNEVDFDAITFEGGLLTIPTALDSSAVDDAEHLCDVFAGSHTNQTTGDPLGFEEIEILSADGEVAATCKIAD